MRKGKIIFTFVCVGIVVVSFLTPLTVSLASASASKISYKTGTPGITLEGNLKQYGREGKYSTPVNVQISKGFEFLRWNDGNTEQKRSDVFTKQDKSFTAYARYSLYDAPLLQIGIKRTNIDFSTPYNATANFFSNADNEDEIENIELTISKSMTYENIKSQTKCDYYVNFKTTPFSSTKYRFLSQFNDKTFLHNTFAYKLIEESGYDNIKKIDYLNLTLDNDFCGLYLLLEDTSCMFERKETTQIDWEISIFNCPQGINATLLQDGFGYEVLNNNTRKTSKSLCEKVSEEISMLKNGNLDNFDKNSISLYLALNDFFKNNSCIENNIYLYHWNDKIYIDPYISFSLSSPLFKWYNYTSEGNSLIHRFLQNANNDNEINIIKKNYLRTFLNCGIEKLNESIYEMDKYNESINSEIDLYGLNNNVFGLPEEFYSLDNRKALIDYYKNWLDKRIDWLDNNE